MCVDCSVSTEQKEEECGAIEKESDLFFIVWGRTQKVTILTGDKSWDNKQRYGVKMMMWVADLPFDGVRMLSY